MAAETRGEALDEVLAARQALGRARNRLHFQYRSDGICWGSAFRGLARRGQAKSEESEDYNANPRRTSGIRSHSDPPWTRMEPRFLSDWIVCRPDGCEYSLCSLKLQRLFCAEYPQESHTLALTRCQSASVTFPLLRLSPGQRRLSHASALG